MHQNVSLCGNRLTRSQTTSISMGECNTILSTYTKYLNNSPADHKSNVAKIMISLLDSIENTVGKGENAGYQHFLLFPQCFQKAYSLGTL